MKVLLFIVLGVLFSWCMWIKGIGIMQKKIAVAFIGRRGKAHRGAAMTRCKCASSPQTPALRSTMPCRRQ